MSKYASPSVKIFLVGGRSVLSSTTEITGPEIESLTEETTPFGDDWQAHTVLGLRKVSFGAAGWYDDAQNAANDAWLNGQTASQVVCLGLEGNTVGKKFIGLEGAFSAKYARLVSRNALHHAKADLVVTGILTEAYILQELASKTADWNTEASSVDTGLAPATISTSSVANPTVITTSAAHGFKDGQTVLIAGHSGSTPSINGSYQVSVVSPTTFTIPVNVTVGGTGGTVTASGGAAFQQVTALSGFTGFVGKVRHSADNITFADLATFTNVTGAPAVERVAVSSATAVNRYVAFSGDVTGTGSITLMAGFGRG